MCFSQATSSNNNSNRCKHLLLELQGRSKDIARQKFLIKNTLEARQDLEADEKIQRYPYLKNGEMVCTYGPSL